VQRKCVSFRGKLATGLANTMPTAETILIPPTCLPLYLEMCWQDPPSRHFLVAMLLYPNLKADCLARKQVAIYG